MVELRLRTWSMFLFGNFDVKNNPRGLLGFMFKNDAVGGLRRLSILMQ